MVNPHWDQFRSGAELDGPDRIRADRISGCDLDASPCAIHQRRVAWPWNSLGLLIQGRYLAAQWPSRCGLIRTSSSCDVLARPGFPRPRPPGSPAISRACWQGTCKPSGDCTSPITWTVILGVGARVVTPNLAELLASFRATALQLDRVSIGRAMDIWKLWSPSRTTPRQGSTRRCA